MDATTAIPNQSVRIQHAYHEQYGYCIGFVEAIALRIAHENKHCTFLQSFTAAPDVLDQVRSSPAILQYARNKGTIRRLVATYYDTVDHQLFNAGLSLRVRRSGKHFTQTIKRLPVNGPPTREEWEAPGRREHT